MTKYKYKAKFIVISYTGNKTVCELRSTEGRVEAKTKEDAKVEVTKELYNTYNVRSESVGIYINDIVDIQLIN